MATSPLNRNAFLLACAALLGSLKLAAAEAIIGFDGLEHDYPRARQHVAAQRALHVPQVHHVHHDSSGAAHAVHMLNHGHRRSARIHAVRNATSVADGAAASAQEALKEQPAAAMEQPAAQEAAVSAAVAREEAQLHKSMEVLRAQLCVRRSQDPVAWRRDEREKCRSFMVTACDRRRERGPVMQQACSAFFEQHLVEQAAKAADEAIVDDSEAPAGLVVASSPFAAPAAAPFAAPGPAPAPEAAPAPAPEPEWTYGMGMEEYIKSPEQGFEGPKVAHDDMETFAGDWQKEYGRHAQGESSLRKICAKYPDSEWCRVHGYHKPKEVPKKAGANAKQHVNAVAALISLACAAAGLL